MNKEQYLELFCTNNESLVSVLGDIADYYISSLGNYELTTLNLDGQHSIVVLNDFKFVNKANSNFVDFVYLGTNSVLVEYFKDLSENLWRLPISLLWDEDSTFGEQSIAESLLNSGTIAILSDYIESSLCKTKLKILKESNFYHENNFMSSDTFESIFCNPVREFLKLLLSDTNTNCQELKRVIGRRSEIVGVYRELMKTLKDHIFNLDIINLLGSINNRKNIWAYNQYLNIYQYDIEKLITWKNEHKYKPLLLEMGVFLKRLNILDSDTFGKKNLVLPFEERFTQVIDSDSPIFFDAQSYKFIWGMNESVLMVLLNEIGIHQKMGQLKKEVKPSVALFMNTTYWFSRTKYSSLDHQIVKKMLKGKFVNDFLKNEKTNKNIDKFCYGMEALYGYAISRKFENTVERDIFIDDVQDYMVAMNDSTPFYTTFTKNLNGTSLRKKADVWHKNIKIERYKKYKFDLDKDTHVIDSINFDLITNIDDLIKEGSEMEHCALTYAPEIYDDEYLIYRVYDELNQTRATLGLKLVAGKFVVDQVRGYDNCKPTDRIISACLDFFEQKYPLSN